MAVPWRFDFQGSYAELSMGVEGRVSWAWGLLCLDAYNREGGLDLSASLLGYKRQLPPRSSKKPPVQAKPARKGNQGGAGIASYINWQVFAAVRAFLQKLRDALHLRLNLSGLYGFDEPDLTGITLGALAMMANTNVRLDLKPDFTRGVLELEGGLQGWLIPLHIIGIVIGFLFKKSIRAIWLSQLKFNKKSKEVPGYV